jgi:hypothetical protein
VFKSRQKLYFFSLLYATSCILGHGWARFWRVMEVIVGLNRGERVRGVFGLTEVSTQLTRLGHFLMNITCTHSQLYRGGFCRVGFNIKPSGCACVPESSPRTSAQKYPHQSGLFLFSYLYAVLHPRGHECDRSHLKKQQQYCCSPVRVFFWVLSFRPFPHLS